MRGVRRHDGWIPLALAVLGTVELIGLDVEGKPAAITLELVVCGLLVLRRRWPWAVPTLAGVLILLLPYLGPELNDPSVPILVVGVASWTMGRHLPDLRGLASMSLFLLVILSAYAVTSEQVFDISNLVFLCVVLLPPYVAGRGARSLAERNRRLVEQAAELRRLQEVVRTEAAAAERGRPPPWRTSRPPGDDPSPRRAACSTSSATATTSSGSHLTSAWTGCRSWWSSSAAADCPSTSTSRVRSPIYLLVLIFRRTGSYRRH